MIFYNIHKDNYMNSLFNKLVNTVTKQQQSNIIPFAVGRIYQCRYRNFKQDPAPLILILGSNNFYTVGINLHYVSAFSHNIEAWIMMMRKSKKILTGKIIYDVMKMRIPMVPKIAYRKYFTSMLRGRLISQGLYTGPEMAAMQLAMDPFVRRLNKKINGSIAKAAGPGSEELAGIRSQITQSSYASDSQRPFANRTQKTVVQYRPPGV